MQAKGTFDTKATPGDTLDAGAPPIGRMTIDKTFAGDFVGTGKVWMTTAMTATQGSAVYVAIERMSGVLHGKRGTFALHHTGVMNRGAQTLTVGIVPDSGTDELAGISGDVHIEIVNGQHFYTLDYDVA